MNQHIKVEKALKQTYEQITAGAKLLMNHTNDYQDIEKYLLNRINDIEFSQEQQIKIDRYNFIINQCMSGKYSKLELINQIQHLFKISKRQAYADFKIAGHLQLITAINKQFELQIELCSARHMLNESIKANDFETALQVQENIFKILKMITDEKLQAGEDFESNIIEVVFDPQLLGGPEIDMNVVLAVINAKRNKKITADMFNELHSNAPCSP